MKPFLTCCDPHWQGGWYHNADCPRTPFARVALNRIRRMNERLRRQWQDEDERAGID